MSKIIHITFLMLLVAILGCEDRAVTNPLDPKYYLMPPTLEGAFIDESGSIELSWNNEDGSPEYFNIYKRLNDGEFEYQNNVSGDQRHAQDSPLGPGDTTYYKVEADWYGRVSPTSYFLSVHGEVYGTRFHHFTDQSVARRLVKLSANELLISAAIRDRSGNTYERSILAMCDKFGNQRWKIEMLDPRAPLFTLTPHLDLMISSGNELRKYDRYGHHLFTISYDPILSQDMAVSQQSVHLIVQEETDGILSEDHTLYTLDLSSKKTTKIKLWTGYTIRSSAIEAQDNGSLFLTGNVTGVNQETGGDISLAMLENRNADLSTAWAKEFTRFTIIQILITERGPLLLGYNSDDQTYDGRGNYLIQLDAQGEPIWTCFVLEDEIPMKMTQTSSRLLVKAGNVNWTLFTFGTDGSSLGQQYYETLPHQHDVDITAISADRLALLGHVATGGKDLYIKFIEALGGSQ